MGAAAQQRGDKLIALHAWQEVDERIARENAVRALEIAEECNEFVRQAMSYIVEPRGIRATTIERAKTRRGWAKRHRAVVSNHNKWVDIDCRNAYAYHSASVARAKAVYELFIFALGCWTIPANIRVPRAAT